MKISHHENFLVSNFSVKKLHLATFQFFSYEKFERKNDRET